MKRSWPPMMKKLTFLLFLTLIISGCDRFPQTVSGYRTDPDFRYMLWVSRKRFEIGEPLTIRFSVTNMGNEPIEIVLEDLAVMGIVITTDGLSKVVVRLPDMAESFSELHLNPGETRTIEMTWVPDNSVYQHRLTVWGGFNLDSEGRRGVTASVEICHDGACYGY